MNYRKAFISSTIVLSCYAAAAFADAKADGINPYLPVPAASSETPDHGVGTYCRIGLTIPGWTCDQELAGAGEGPDRMGFEARVSRTNPDPKPSPASPSPSTPKGGDL